MGIVLARYHLHMPALIQYMLHVSFIVMIIGRPGPVGGGVTGDTGTYLSVGVVCRRHLCSTWLENRGIGVVNLCAARHHLQKPRCVTWRTSR